MLLFRQRNPNDLGVKFFPTELNFPLTSDESGEKLKRLKILSSRALLEPMTKEKKHAKDWQVQYYKIVLY